MNDDWYGAWNEFGLGTWIVVAFSIPFTGCIRGRPPMFWRCQDATAKMLQEAVSLRDPEALRTP